MNYHSISDQLSISKQELNFLQAHKISTDEIYNAFGISFYQFTIKMKPPPRPPLPTDVECVLSVSTHRRSVSDAGWDSGYSPDETTYFHDAFSFTCYMYRICFISN